MKCTTVVLAMALLMVPLVSATAMAQMKPMAQTEPEEAGEELAQNLTEAFGQIDIMSIVPPVIVDVLDTLCGGLWSLITPVWTLIVDGIGAVIAFVVDVFEGIGLLWAGFNDINIESYAFQSAKICAFAIADPVLWCWNLMGAIHVIPCCSWGLACVHGIAQLALLWLNLFINLCQHAILL